MAQLVECWVQHAADADLASCCCKFFFSHSQLSMQTLTILVWSPCAIAGINISVHDKKNQALVAIPLFEHMKT